MSLPGGTVPVNSEVVEVIDVIKPQAIELVSYCNQVSLVSCLRLAGDRAARERNFHLPF